MKNWGGQAVGPRSLALVFIDGVVGMNASLIALQVSWLHKSWCGHIEPY